MSTCTVQGSLIMNMLISKMLMQQSRAPSPSQNSTFLQNLGGLLKSYRIPSEFLECFYTFEEAVLTAYGKTAGTDINLSRGGQ